MATIDERIAALQEEQRTLQTAIKAIETEQAAIDSRLDALLAAAERGGGDDDIVAAREVESVVATLGAELRRKRAALVACERDLSAAKDERAAAQRAKVKGDLIALYDLYAEMVNKLEADIGNADLWVRLSKLVDEANALYLARIYKGGEGMPVRLLTRPLDVRRRVFEALGERLDWAMGLRGERPKELTPAGIFELELLSKRVRHL